MFNLFIPWGTIYRDLAVNRKNWGKIELNEKKLKKTTLLYNILYGSKPTTTETR